VLSFDIICPHRILVNPALGECGGVSTLFSGFYSHPRLHHRSSGLGWSVNSAGSMPASPCSAHHDGVLHSWELFSRLDRSGPITCQPACTPPGCACFFTIATASSPYQTAPKSLTGSPPPLAAKIAPEQRHLFSWPSSLSLRFSVGILPGGTGPGPLRYSLSNDTYFVACFFHYIRLGGTVFRSCLDRFITGSPKFTGRCLTNHLGPPALGRSPLLVSTSALPPKQAGIGLKLAMPRPWLSYDPQIAPMIETRYKQCGSTPAEAIQHPSISYIEWLGVPSPAGG